MTLLTASPPAIIPQPAAPPTGTIPVIELDAVEHGYGARSVLDGLSLQLFPGEVAVLVGSSGCGKSTLLRLVAGLERPRRGRVSLRGVLAADGASGRFMPPERRHVGMVFQDAALWPHLRVRDNVALALPPGTRRPREDAEELLAEVQLAGFGDRRPDTLSGGQKQRVALARALASGADLLLLDEPLSALDEPVRDRLRPLIRDVVRRRGGSALVVSHDRTDAWRLADRIVVLERGGIAQSGTPRHLYAAPETETVARYMGAAGAVPVVGLDGGWVALTDGSTVRVSTRHVADRRPGRLLAYPEAVRLAERGTEAILLDRAFEGGRWRGRWRLRFGEGELEAFHDQPPPEAGFLALDPGGTFAFP